MRAFFRPNIATSGRILRAVLGLALLVGGWLAWASAPVLAVLLGLSGLFAIFEAARGWCLARACGIKTRI